MQGLDNPFRSDDDFLLGSYAAESLDDSIASHISDPIYSPLRDWRNSTTSALVCPENLNFIGISLTQSTRYFGADIESDKPKPGFYRYIYNLDLSLKPEHHSFLFQDQIEDLFVLLQSSLPRTISRHMKIMMHPSHYSKNNSRLSKDEYCIGYHDWQDSIMVGDFNLEKQKSLDFGNAIFAVRLGKDGILGEDHEIGGKDPHSGEPIKEQGTIKIAIFVNNGLINSTVSDSFAYPSINAANIKRLEQEVSFKLKIVLSILPTISDWIITKAQY